MDYQEAMKYLDSLVSTGIRLELGPITEACRIFDNPQLAYPTMHIAGTNGKGSTAAFLASILIHSGYSVGLYTSPHLVDVRERIRINMEPISEANFADITERIRDALPHDKMLTYFEFLTLMSFIFFKEKKVDIAVVETGLGGRLDATNVVTPLVTIITPISLDHKEHLGDSLAKIAEEKCGIIKRGVPTVVANQPPQVMSVIRRWCDEMGSPLCLAGPEEISQPLGLKGRHQMQNAACAVEAAHLLSHTKFHIKNIDEALLATRWAGRIETVSESPRVILDGAHNPDGAEALAGFISEEIDRKHAVLMLGIMADKDIKGICRPLVPVVREVICIRAPTKRGASPKDIAAMARSFGAVVHYEDDIPSAISKWMKKLSSSDTLIISGSLATAGEAKKYFSK
jgi:dihydrofolate synthase/folylpolyglutamate synthase